MDDSGVPLFQETSIYSNQEAWLDRRGQLLIRHRQGSGITLAGFGKPAMGNQMELEYIYI